MKRYRNLIAFVIFLIMLTAIFILLKYYSGQISLRQDGYYEITFRVKGEYEKIDSIKNKLASEIGSQVVIENISKNQYRLIFGKYSDSYDAGESAFNLYADSVITNYKIMLDGRETADNYTNVLFTGRSEERASLYSLNLLTKKTALVWSDWGEDVVSLEQSAKKKFSFFLTVSGQGRKNGMSYLYDARLYHYDWRKENIKMIEYLKNGYQYYSSWNAGNQFMTNFNSLDSSSNQEVIQSFSVYDTSGVRLKNFTKKFNLIKDGYPNPPQRKLDFTSAKNRYLFYTKLNDKGEKNIFIKRNYTSEEYLVGTTKGNILDIAWSGDEKYLFFIYSDLKNISKKVKKNEYFCMVFDADSKKSIRLFKGGDFKLLSVQGRLLIIESGYGIDSKIMFYDYIKDKIYINFDFNGGCAIKNLPLAK